MSTALGGNLTSTMKKGTVTLSSIPSPSETLKLMLQRLSSVIAFLDFVFDPTLNGILIFSYSTKHLAWVDLG